MRTVVQVLLLAIALAVPGRARGDMGSLSTPIMYAATTAFVDTFTPSTGGPSTVVDITGSNFGNVTAISFDNTPASFTILQPTHLRATVPTLSVVTTKPVIIRVTTAGGTNPAPTPFTYVPPPRTVVPNVAGLNLVGATQLIAQAGLVVGTIIGPSAANSIVASQFPTAGASVPRNSSVTLTTNPGFGARTIAVLNNRQDQVSVFMWLWDATTQTWSLENNQALLEFGFLSSATSLETGHQYMVYAVDPDRDGCDGDNNPANNSCVAWQSNPSLSIPGDTSGVDFQLEVD